MEVQEQIATNHYLCSVTYNACKRMEEQCENEPFWKSTLDSLKPKLNISSGQLLQYFQILFAVVAPSCEFKVYSPDKTISIVDSANN